MKFISLFTVLTLIFLNSCSNKYWEKYGNLEGWESLGAVELIDTLSIENSQYKISFKPKKNDFYVVYIGFPNSEFCNSEKDFFNEDNPNASDQINKEIDKKYDGTEVVITNKSNSDVLFEKKVFSNRIYKGLNANYKLLVLKCNNYTKHYIDITPAIMLKKNTSYKIKVKFPEQGNYIREMSPQIIMISSGFPIMP